MLFLGITKYEEVFQEYFFKNTLFCESICFPSSWGLKSSYLFQLYLIRCHWYNYLKINNLIQANSTPAAGINLSVKILRSEIGIVCRGTYTWRHMCTVLKEISALHVTTKQLSILNWSVHFVGYVSIMHQRPEFQRSQDLRYFIFERAYNWPSTLLRTVSCPFRGFGSKNKV